MALLTTTNKANGNGEGIDPMRRTRIWKITVSSGNIRFRRCRVPSVRFFTIIPLAHYTYILLFMHTVLVNGGLQKN
ncbi:unnamed protein product [Allacma fusca]|uniref:Uncharacterized protein n=1 Tax=Allacma fusca TaxID=39272 RepID=A0A8J2JYY9_9HEXA|nr:unnamed protein product [Allacma fusca]